MQIREFVHTRHEGQGVSEMEERITTNKAPKTDSIEELAKFWDEHDLTDFKESLVEVQAPVFKRGADASIEIRLTATEAMAVQRMAKSAGVSQAVLIQKWVRAHLKPRRKNAKF